MNDCCNIIGEICRLDIPITTYVINHILATIGKKMGIPTKILQDALEYTDLAITEAYLDCLEDKVVDEANKRIVS